MNAKQKTIDQTMFRQKIKEEDYESKSLHRSIINILQL